jgi:hypothetical protein
MIKPKEFDFPNSVDVKSTYDWDDRDDFEDGITTEEAAEQISGAVQEILKGVDAYRDSSMHQLMATIYKKLKQDLEAGLDCDDGLSFDFLAFDGKIFLSYSTTELVAEAARAACQHPHMDAERKEALAALFESAAKQVRDSI